MSLEITKLMLIPVNNLCYLIKRLSLSQLVLSTHPLLLYQHLSSYQTFVVSSNSCHRGVLNFFSSGFTLVWWFHRIFHRVKLSAGPPSPYCVDESGPFMPCLRRNSFFTVRISATQYYLDAAHPLVSTITRKNIYNIIRDWAHLLWEQDKTFGVLSLRVGTWVPSQ